MGGGAREEHVDIRERMSGGDVCDVKLPLVRVQLMPHHVESAVHCCEVGCGVGGFDARAVPVAEVGESQCGGRLGDVDILVGVWDWLGFQARGRFVVHDWESGACGSAGVSGWG